MTYQPCYPAVPTHLAALDLAGRLGTARAALAHCTADVLACERELAQHKALAELALIATVDGDEKKLGANEDARKRAYLLHLEQDTPYLTARIDLDAAELERRMTEVEVKLLSDQLSILLAAMGAGVSDLPADWADSSLADERIAWVSSTTTAEVAQ